MADVLYGWDVAGLILGVFALGMTFFIWHNQDKAAKETKRVIDKVDGITTKLNAFNEALKDRMESAKIASFKTVYFYLSASFRLLDKVYVEVRKLDNDPEARLKYFRGQIELIKGVLGTEAQVTKELDFLKANYLKEYGMIKGILPRLVMLKDYGELVAVNQQGLNDWIGKCYPTLEKLEELLNHLYNEIKQSND